MCNWLLDDNVRNEGRIRRKGEKIWVDQLVGDNIKRAGRIRCKGIQVYKDITQAHSVHTTHPSAANKTYTNASFT